MRLTCRAARRALPLLVGNDLPASRGDRVRRHLLDCFACARLFASYREARETLRSLLPGEGEGVPGIWERVRARVPASAGGRAWRPSIAAAAAAILAASAFVLWSLSAEEGGDAPPSPVADSTPALERLPDPPANPRALRRIRRLGPEFYREPLLVEDEPANPWSGVPLRLVGPLPAGAGGVVPVSARRDF